MAVVGLTAAALVLCLLAGCVVTPRRVELATNKAEQCSNGCVLITGKRITFRHRF